MQEKQGRHANQLKRKVNTPEGVPRLFDLIKVKDERLKLGFYELLKNTVVAKDLEQVKFSYSTFKCYFHGLIRILICRYAPFVKSSTSVSGTLVSQFKSLTIMRY